MIPLAHLQAWRDRAAWPDLQQVEQDLIICRSLCDLFQNPALRGKVAFRGGTAIHKLLFAAPLRYSEDIDLVQLVPEPIGKLVDGIRSALNWLGRPRRTQAGHSMHLVFQFAPEGDAAARMKLKVEINTREHEPFYPLRGYPFSVANPWYSGDCEIHSYEPDELFGTKLRALLQRNKNRDLFDLWQGLRQRTLNPGNVVRALQHYLECGQTPISRANAEERMLKKLTRSLSEDVAPLLPPAASFTEEEAITAFGRVWRELIALIPGEPWKRSEQVIERLRATRLPKLLS